MTDYAVVSGWQSLSKHSRTEHMKNSILRVGAICLRALPK